MRKFIKYFFITVLGLSVLVAVIFYFELTALDKMSKEYPLPGHIFSDYYAGNCQPFCGISNDSDYAEICHGIYNSDETIMFFPEKGTLLNYASDGKRYIAVVFCETFEEPKNLYIVGGNTITLYEFKKHKNNDYYVYLVFDTKSRKTVQFEKFNELLNYCTKNDINLFDWYQLCESSAPKIDINKIVKDYEQ